MWVHNTYSLSIPEKDLLYASNVFSEQEIVPYRIEDIPRLGFAKFGILVQEPSFLAVPVTKQVVPTEIHQNDGVIRYSMNQRANVDAFTFRHDGLWNNDFFVIGEIATLHSAGIAVGIAKKLRYHVRMRFHYQNRKWIGPECYRHYSSLPFTTDYQY